uniref:Uncharacterized protein n=1 Tax=Gossypium raimondii TaxID=29730 RepID=A0A0D2RV12_GOSRA|nr:hypothetical protein B456_012G122500 [Gossypium raimondii]
MGFKKVYKCFMDIFPQLLLSRTLRMWTQLRRLFYLRLCLTYLNEPWLVVLPHGIGALLMRHQEALILGGLELISAEMIPL